jgi:hypothetical protein
MSRDKQLIVGVLVLAGLSGLVYYRMQEDKKVGSAKTTSSDPLPELKVEDVDKVTVGNADKGEITLERSGEGDAGVWSVTKPVQAAANQANVKSMTDNLKEVKIKELIAADVGDDQKKQFEVDSAKGVHVQAWKGAEKKLDVTYGKSGGRGQLAMVGGKNNVYSVEKFSSWLYTRELTQWRDTEIFKFDDANAISMVIENKSGKLSFTKGGDKWAGTFKDKPIERFDEDKLKDALRVFKGLAAEDFGDGKPVSETGLDAPEAKVTVALKDNAGTYVIKVGKVKSGTSRFATKDGSETIFVLGASASDWATGGADKFQKPSGDAGAPKDGGPKLGMPPGVPGMPPGHPPMPE